MFVGLLALRIRYVAAASEMIAILTCFCADQGVMSGIISAPAFVSDFPEVDGDVSTAEQTLRIGCELISSLSVYL